VRFRDRTDAGRRLAPLLLRFAGERPIVLGLPRGGVVVAREVARALDAPLDVIVVRKLGSPIQPELGMGAIAEGGATFVDQDIVESVAASDEEVDDVIVREQGEVARRVDRYRGGRPLPDVKGRTVILVDDGIATGGTVRTAIRALRAYGAKRIVVAAPVAAGDKAEQIGAEADAIVCATTPEMLFAIGDWYDDFRQVSDQQVVDLLAAPTRAPVSRETVLATEAGALRGVLAVPEGATGIVIFAHGSGSSRHSPRNTMVARTLGAAGLATLLVDLLTEDEEEEDIIDARLRFDIELLARRVVAVVDWVERDPLLRGLRIGCFGSSTGAAAALLAAAERVGVVRAVVSRGGRPDLAGDSLEHVYAPALFIVGGDDRAVLALNESAMMLIPGEKQIVVVPGASHLFEEPGALEAVARFAADWFSRFLAPGEEPLYA
jgi:putative phosphoribosyl transferase